MKLSIILLTISIVAAYYFLVKKGKIADKDGDFIPDAVEDVVDNIKDEVANVKTEVKRRASNIKTEINDVSKAVKEVGNQMSDVVEAAKGKQRKGRKPAAKKSTKK